MNPSSSLLTLRGIRKSYGPIEVLHGIDMHVDSGEVVALLGENGAGKSTVSKLISGAIQPSAGQMSWQGELYVPSSPREALDTGVGMIHQELLLLPDLTIAENMFVGRYPTRAGRVDRAAMQTRAKQGLERLGLKISPQHLVAGLSTANQQLVEIAKALTLNARLLILDEPTSALGAEETHLLFEQIRQLKKDGVGIIYISHRLDEIHQIADRIVVFRDGNKVAEHDNGAVPVRTIVESMVGRNLEQLFPTLPTPSEEVVLTISELTSKAGHFSGINFQVRRGEIFGIAGLIGAGRTELVRAIAGADPIDSGTVQLQGKDVTPSRPSDSINNGIVLVPEDRKLQGLVVEHSIEENMAYCNLNSIANSGWITSKRVRLLASENIERFGVKGHGPQLASELSGGNQQKVVIAKWLARKPDVVLLDEPTRGIDVGARSSIYELINQLAESGVAVIVVSSDLEEVLGVAHRIMVMAAGRQTGILDREDANDVSVMELATA